MLTVDPSVFLLKQPRVKLLRTGKISVQLLANLIRPLDWLYLDGCTVKALNQMQYNALQRMPDNGFITLDIIDRILKGDFKDKLPQEVITAVQNAQQSMSGCPSCKRQKLLGLLRVTLAPYRNILCPAQVLTSQAYPQTSGQIPFIHTQKQLPYPKYDSKRKPCFDCVQKHIGQAYVTGKQALCGYPEHFLLSLGHLAQAIQECPPTAKILHNALVLCLGYSRLTNRAFVPLTLLFNTVNLEQSLSAPEQLQPLDSIGTFQLDYTVYMDKLDMLTPAQKHYLILTITECTNSAKKCAEKTDKYTQCRLIWQGLMSNLSERLSQVSVDIANVIRNIRLLFSATPELILNTEYDPQGLRIELLQSKRSTQVGSRQ